VHAQSREALFHGHFFSIVEPNLIDQFLFLKYINFFLHLLFEFLRRQKILNNTFFQILITDVKLIMLYKAVDLLAQYSVDIV
jgi:hypothetical protein